ncbi:hypothetical protein KC318_g4728 [Hortaea werneckii]|nr:hypothetical protein KC334_g3819 [Hortaea werneckii]KAI7016947.1 hypothetical protein KC355_g3819 [Hortaea werneckii]KAI7197080.1 hypothetical protein KC324_g4286 [Hortaea werneckii]KAI7587306.1 hypothetical protein KC316_g5119 [Hortaea werneckii]KAI7669328.1 hypothetical protein KC318_g4728 [Hortaea werneckii]
MADTAGSLNSDPAERDTGQTSAGHVEPVNPNAAHSKCELDAISIFASISSLPHLTCERIRNESLTPEKARYDRLRSYSQCSSRRYPVATDDVGIDMSVCQEGKDAATKTGPEDQDHRDTAPTGRSAQQEAGQASAQGVYVSPLLPFAEVMVPSAPNVQIAPMIASAGLPLVAPCGMKVRDQCQTALDQRFGLLYSQNLLED